MGLDDLNQLIEQCRADVSLGVFESRSNRLSIRRMAGAEQGFESSCRRTVAERAS